MVRSFLPTTLLALALVALAPLATLDAADADTGHTRHANTAPEPETPAASNLLSGHGSAGDIAGLNLDCPTTHAGQTAHSGAAQTVPCGSAGNITGTPVTGSMARTSRTPATIRV